MKKILKRIPMKLWALLCVLVALTFFTNDFGLVDIQKTALVLAAGIDRTEDGFALTAQIAVPKGTDRTTGGTSSVEIEGNGATVPDCLADLYAQTGWVPKLIYCDLVLLGESTVTDDVFDCLDYFLRNEYVPDSCLLAACEGSAGEMLSSTSAIDDTSALALEKLFSDAAQKSGQVMTTTLREFAIGYFGASKSGYMPYVRAQAQEGGGQEQGDAQNSAGAQRSGQQQKIYSAQETAVFSEGRMAALLSPEETFAFSLLEGNVYAGTFAADGKTYIILKNSGSVNVETAPAPAIGLEIACKVQLYGENKASPPDTLAKGTISAQEEERLSQLLTGYARSLWQTCAQAECDLLFFRRSLQRSSMEVYGKWKDIPLISVSADISARVRSLK